MYTCLGRFGRDLLFNNVRRVSPRRAQRVLAAVFIALAGLGFAAARAAAQSWTEQGDAGQLCSTAQMPVGSGTLSQINGATSSIQDADAYRIHINSPVSFSASTTGTSLYPDKILFLFNASNCNGIVMSNFASNGQTATINGSLVSVPGDYILVLAPYGKVPQNASALNVWTQNFQSTQTSPNGPGAPGPITGWGTNSFSQTTGSYSISLAGATFPSSPPSNDLCANATALSSTGGATSFDTSGAGTDGGSACGSGGSDIWYTFTPTGCGGTTTVDTCAANNYDSVVAVYTGSCGSLTLVGCNDDTTGCGSLGTSSRVSFTATPGTTYRIRVMGFQGAQGTGTLTVTPPPCTPVTITQQPPSFVRVKVGQPISVPIAVSGTGPFTYVWKRLGSQNAIAGQTSATYSVASASGPDMNTYYCEISNCCSTVRTRSFAICVDMFGHLQPSLPGCTTPTAWTRDDDGDGYIDAIGDIDGDVNPKNRIADYLDAHHPVNGTAVLCMQGEYHQQVKDILTNHGFGAKIGHSLCIVPVIELINISYADLVAIAGLQELIDNRYLAFIQPNFNYRKHSVVSMASMQVTHGFYSPNTISDHDGWVDGSGVNVVVMDTGVDNPGSHIDVNTASAPGTLNLSLPTATWGYDVQRDFSLATLPNGALHAECIYDPDDDDNQGHGTYMASLILGHAFGGVPRGAAPGANLIDIKVMDQTGLMTSMMLMRGLEVVWNQQIFGTGPIHVLYIGAVADVANDQIAAVSQVLDIVAGGGAVPPSPPLGQTIIVAPAGDDTDLDPSARLKRLPGAHPAVIAVGAYDDGGFDDRSLAQLWQYTPSGPAPLNALDSGNYSLRHIRPQLVAPGVNVLGADHNSMNGTRSLTGSSVAAAHVAGVAALLLHAGCSDPLATLISTADLPASAPTFDPSPYAFAAGQEPPYRWNAQWGYGMVNAFAALDSFIVRQSDVAFVDANGNPADYFTGFTLETPQTCGGIAMLKVRVKNFGPYYAVRDLTVGFSGGSASGTITSEADSAHQVFSSQVVQRWPLPIQVGETVELHVRCVIGISKKRKCNHYHLHCRTLRNGILRLHATLFSPMDSSFWNNTVTDSDHWPCSPASFEVANHVTSGPATFNFVVTPDTPGTQWQLQLDASSVTLSPEDEPAVITALPIPPPGAVNGDMESFTVTTMWGSEIVGQIKIHPTMLDCNGNGCDDWFDIEGGPNCPAFAQDFDFDGIPDNCQCGHADFNGDGDVGTDADIEAFFACLAGNCCPTCGSADFNHNGDIGTDQDIEAFFRVLGGGPC